MFNPKKAGGRGGQFEPPCGFSKNVFFRGGGGAVWVKPVAKKLMKSAYNR